MLCLAVVCPHMTIWIFSFNRTVTGPTQSLNLLLGTEGVESNSVTDKLICKHGRCLVFSSFAYSWVCLYLSHHFFYLITVYNYKKNLSLHACTQTRTLAHMLIGYSFFHKIGHYFFTAILSFYSNCMFSFLDMLQYIGMTSMLY